MSDVAAVDPQGAGDWEMECNTPDVPATPPFHQGQCLPDFCGGKCTRVLQKCFFAPEAPGQPGYCLPTLSGKLLCHTENRLLCAQFNADRCTGAAGDCGGGGADACLAVTACGSPLGICPAFVWPCSYQGDYGDYPN